MKPFLQLFSVFLFPLALIGIDFSDPVEFEDPSGSNLGEQQIIEVVRKWVGPTPQELAPGVVALGSLKERKYLLEDPEEVGGELVEVGEFEQSSPAAGGNPLPKVDSDPIKSRFPHGWVGPLPEELAPGVIALGSLSAPRSLHGKGGHADEQESEEEGFGNVSVFTSGRTYFTNNVLRQKSDKKKSMVLENALGVSLGTQGIGLGDYVTMVPRIDMMMQVATYENEEVKDLLGYGFGMVKGGVNFELPSNYSVSTGLEYNLLHSMDSGDRMFDAWAPSLKISKMYVPAERTLVMADLSMKFALTEKVITFQAPGVFADDGDNLQLGMNMALIQLLDADGKFILMPRVGLTRTEYLKNEQDGRVDWMVNAGVGFTWQALEWLSLDLGAGWSTLWMNEKGKSLQGESSRFQAWDLGLTLLASHIF